MNDTDALLTSYLGILPHTPEERTLRLLIDLGLQIVGADEGSLLVMDEEAQALRFLMIRSEGPDSQELLGQHVPLGQGIVGLAASTGEIQIGAPTLTREGQAPKGLAMDIPQAVLAAPMLIHDHLIGVITAVSLHGKKRFTSHEARLYAGFAAIAAVVVDLRRKLSSYEHHDGQAPLRALGSAARREQEILRSVEQILHQRPESLDLVARLMSSIEALVMAEERVPL